MHPELSLDVTGDGVGVDEANEEPSAKDPPRQSIRPTEERGLTKRDTSQEYNSFSCVRSPPIIHRGRNDDTRLKRELCMIPKKKYLHAHEMQKNSCRPGMSPPPHQNLPSPQRQVSTSYSESDVSIAMILANGFGRDGDDKTTESPDASNTEEV